MDLAGSVRGMGWCREGMGGKGWKKEKGGEKGGGGKGWRRGRVEEGKGGDEKGTEWRGGKVGRDCAVLKFPLKSTGPRPSLTLRQIDAPVQDLVHAIWALFHVYF